MANPLRFLDESFACVDEDGQRWFLVEVTQRIHRGRYLLRPGRDTRAVRHTNLVKEAFRDLKPISKYGGTKVG